jgi:hypothetical protein
MSRYVVLRKENHMHLTEGANIERKAGEAEGSAVPQNLLGKPGLFLKMIVTSPVAEGSAVCSVRG